MNAPLAASSLATALIAAGASLLGGVVGGLISFLTQRASQNALRAEDRARRKRASDAAWGLLRIEVGNARDAVYEIRQTGEWPIGWRRTWSSAWRDSREQLLLSPPAEDALWPVAAACARIDELENAVNTGRGEHMRRLSGGDQIFLWRMQRLLEPACEVLDYRSDANRPEDPTEDAIDEWQQKAARARADP